MYGTIFNQNNQSLINLNYYSKNSKYIKDDFINLLKKLFKNVYSYVEIFSKNEDKIINNSINIIKEDFLSIKEVLSHMPLYEKEYYNFTSISDMSLYILDDLFLLKKNLYFIKEMVVSFREIIELKINLNESDYENEYADFTSKLIRWEQYFYTQIYTPSKFYDDEAIANITNSLLHL